MRLPFVLGLDIGALPFFFFMGGLNCFSSVICQAQHINIALWYLGRKSSNMQPKRALDVTYCRTGNGRRLTLIVHIMVHIMRRGGRHYPNVVNGISHLARPSGAAAGAAAAA
jgi:hypothetical protein